MTLQVTNWGENFENNKSRDVDRCSWHRMPNKQHGLGYARMVTGHRQGPAHYGAWVALLGVLSRQSKPRDGYLTDTGAKDGKPLSARDVALQTRFPTPVMETMLQRAVEIGWIKELQQSNKIFHDEKGHPEGTTGALQGHCKGTARPKSAPSIEQNRTEQNIIKSCAKQEVSHNAKSGEVVYKTKRGRKLKDLGLAWFEDFLAAFGDRRGKAAAADAWLDIDWPLDAEEKGFLYRELITGARRYAAYRERVIKPKGGTPKMAQGWLS